MSKFGKRALNAVCCMAIAAAMTACATPASRLDEIEDEVSVEASTEDVSEETSEKEKAVAEVTEEEDSDEEVAAEDSDPVAAAADAPFESDVDADSMYAFCVDGKNYEVPMEFSIFLKSGWDYSDNNDNVPEILKPGEDTRVRLYYRTKGLFAGDFIVRNVEENPMPIEKCEVCHISLCSEMFEENGVEFSLHGGDIKFGATPEEIQEIYGAFDNDINEGHLHFSEFFMGHNVRNRDHSLMVIFSDEDTLREIEIRYED